MKTFFDACVQKASDLIQAACNPKNIKLLSNKFKQPAPSLRPLWLRRAGCGELVEPSPVGRRAGSFIPKIILGLSGGPDSVFLLHVLCELQKQKSITLFAVHLDHQWRQESGRDVEFCAQLCEKLGVEFVAYKAQDLDVKFKCNGSKEELGRKCADLFFNKR